MNRTSVEQLRRLQIQQIRSWHILRSLSASEKGTIAMDGAHEIKMISKPNVDTQYRMTLVKLATTSQFAKRHISMRIRTNDGIKRSPMMKEEIIFNKWCRSVDPRSEPHFRRGKPSVDRKYEGCSSPLQSTRDTVLDRSSKRQLLLEDGAMRCWVPIQLYVSVPLLFKTLTRTL